MGKDSEIEWYSIEGFPAYRVNVQGKVQSCWTPAGQGLNPRIGTTWKSIIGDVANGYRRVTLYTGTGRGRRKLLHRLVLEVFVGSCPADCEARHLDGNRLNNTLPNLAWGTPSENWQDRKLHGRIHSSKGSANARSKLTEEIVLQIRAYAKDGVSIGELATKFSVCKSSISLIVNRRTWRHV